MKISVTIAFGGLCLVAGSTWIYDLFAPGMVTGLARIALHDGLLALVCWIRVLWVSKRRISIGNLLRLGAAGAFVFALPEIVLAGAAAHVTPATEVLTLMLIPACVVFYQGQRSIGFEDEAGQLRGLVPALAAVGGAALILPFVLPSSNAGRLWLAGLTLTAFAAGVATIQVHRLLAAVSIAEAGAAILSVGGLLTASFCRVQGPVSVSFSGKALTFEAIRIVLIDAPILLLSLWLLREMRPVAFASRLVLVPMITVLGGILVERPEVGWYGWSGIVLAIGASCVLVRAQEKTDPPSLFLA